MKRPETSLDAFHGWRDSAGIQRQGRWRCPESVRRYQNATRLPEMLQALTPQQRERAAALDRNIQAWL